MAVSAGAKLLSNYHIDPKTVDVVILYSTMMATSIEPRTLVGEVQHRLQLHRSLGFAVSGQNCASIITVLRMARDLLRSGTAETVLAIGVDSFVGSLRRDIQDISLMGEGASAALIRRGCPTNRLVALANVVEGAFYRTIACSTEEWERFNLLYFITANRLIRRTLDSVSLLLDDIALVVPHNINRASWARLCNQLRLPQEKFFDENIDRCGHICGSDLLINWSDVIAEGRLAKGDLALMVTVGLGAAWGCALIRH
jgi:3-oxoacyl-[acyl-carrier-protein] synthase-3